MSKTDSQAQLTQRIDPRVIRTRLMLRDALMALIPEIGFDAITVQHITDRAALNRATFYLHYRDKQELLMHIIQDVLDELATFTTLPPETSDMRRSFFLLFDHVAKHAAFYRVILAEASVAPYAQQMQETMQNIGLKWLSRDNKPQLQMLTPPDLFISFIGSAYLGVIRWWVLNNMPYTPEYMSAQFMRLAMGGLQRDFGLVETMETLEAELRQNL